MKEVADHTSTSRGQLVEFETAATNTDGKLIFNFYSDHLKDEVTLPMQMGLVHPGTNLGMVLQMMGSLKTVPPRMFRMVPKNEVGCERL